MSEVDATPKRDYLRPDARRRQLLDAAGRVFFRDGLAGMTMVAVAIEANASRRLVYDHFGDAATLYEALFEDRSATYLDQLDLALDSDEEGTTMVGRAFRALLTVPAADLQALRILIADHSPELEGVRGRLRERLHRRWQLPDPGAANAAVLHAVLWTTMTAMTTLADLVVRGDLDADVAVRMGEQLATTLALAAFDAE